jgi:hypothetical protein
VALMLWTTLAFGSGGGSLAVPGADGRAGTPTVQTASCPAPTQQQTTAPGEALLTKMLINDRAVRALWWEQRVLIGDPQKPKPFIRACVGDDGSGRWMAVFQTTGYDSAGAAMPSAPELLLGLPDGTVHSYDPESRRGSSVRAAFHRRSWPTPFGLLGRWIDPRGAHPLPELMLASNDRSIDLSGELPIVTAFLRLPSIGPVVVQVAVDEARGSTPRWIRLEDAEHGGLIEHFHVDEARKVGESWIPVRGRRSAYSVKACSAEEDSRLAASWEREGVPVGTAIQSLSQAEARKRASIRAFGQEGMPVEPMGGADGHAASIVVVEQILAVNDDALVGCLRLPYGEPIEWFDHDLQAPVKPPTGVFAEQGSAQPCPCKGRGTPEQRGEP